MQEATGPFAIRVHDLVVGFGRHVVINQLSLDVRRGEILGLVGASGGGKSVLMRTIIGLIPRQSGTIEVMGAAIADTNDRSTRSAAGGWGDGMGGGSGGGGGGGGFGWRREGWFLS